MITDIPSISRRRELQPTHVNERQGEGRKERRRVDLRAKVNNNLASRSHNALELADHLVPPLLAFPAKINFTVRPGRVSHHSVNASGPDRWQQVKAVSRVNFVELEIH